MRTLLYLSKKKHTEGLETCKKIRKSWKQVNYILEVWKIRIELGSPH